MKNIFRIQRGRQYFSITCIKVETEEEEKKGSSPPVLDGLPTDAYSRARSHYCSTRGLLPAVFPPWAGTSLLRQPGPPGLPRVAHIDAELSADARST